MKLVVGLLDTLLRRYARGEAASVAPHLHGQRVLDLGAGEGYVADALRRTSAVWVCATDVGPYRRVPGPYAVYDGVRLPFADMTFDTTLVLLTLHHCFEPEVVLDEAVRVTRRRLLVVESVYRTRGEHFWLALLDGRLNRLRHDGRMSVPLAFRRPEEWRRLFERRGLHVVETRWLGTALERLIHHPLLFVLDAPPAPRTAAEPRQVAVVSGGR